MIGQPRHRPGVPGTGPALPHPARPADPGESACPRCQSSLDAGDGETGAWCPNCGFQHADPCWQCRAALPAAARFCPRCGTPNTEPAVVACPHCAATVGVGNGYCPACGGQARPVCESCDEPLRKEWGRCPRCGGEPSGSASTSVPIGQPLQEEREDDQPYGRSASSPAAAESLNERAAQAYEAGDVVKAARLFQEAVDADPTVSNYWVNLGVAHEELGEDLQAANTYKRAMEVNPNEIQAYLRMGYLYAQRERQVEAREMWERVVQLAPDGSEAQEARDNLKSLEDL